MYLDRAKQAYFTPSVSWTCCSLPLSRRNALIHLSTPGWWRHAGAGMQSRESTIPRHRAPTTERLRGLSGCYSNPREETRNLTCGRQRPRARQRRRFTHTVQSCEIVPMAASDDPPRGRLRHPLSAAPRAQCAECDLRRLVVARCEYVAVLYNNAAVQYRRGLPPWLRQRLSS